MFPWTQAESGLQTWNVWFPRGVLEPGEESQSSPPILPDQDENTESTGQFSRYSKDCGSGDGLQSPPPIVQDTHLPGPPLAICC